ncbi:MAG: Fic family protein [Spirulinaceae cyanobacterium]
MYWQPIEDLPSDWSSLASTELPPLVRVWNEQAERLRDSGEFKTFYQRLKREIAIETGIIERLYTLDRGITRLLIEQGINEALIPHGEIGLPVKQVVSLIQDQEAAIEGLFDFVGGQRTLSTFYIKQLHQLLTQNQKSTSALNPVTGKIQQIQLIRGDWKRQPNNPLRPDGTVYEYCPPEQIQSEMEQLISLHHEHQSQSVPPEIEAAWLHHRFAQIHPFQDGNGRVARCLASLVFIQEKWFPLVLTRDDRAAYISALEAADQGNLSQLINLFTKSQKQAFLKCLGLSEQIVSEGRNTKVIISSIAQKFQQRRSASIQEQCEQVEGFAKVLFDIAEKKLNDVSDEIKLSVQNYVDDAEVFTVPAPIGDSRSHYHYIQIVETAKQLGYFANINDYHTWIQLVISVEFSVILLFSFHVVGRDYRGLLTCAACAYHRNSGENGENNTSDIQSLTDSPFQFSYADEAENLKVRFQEWLENAVITGLEYWNKSI